MNTSITSFLPKLKFKSNPLVIQGLFYIGLWGGLFALLVFIDGYFKEWSIQQHLLVLVGIIICFGSLNWWLLRKKLFKDSSDLIKTGLTFLGAMLGILLLLIKNRPLEADYLQLYLPALVFFLLPWLLALAVQAHIAIPALAYAPIEVHSLEEYVGNPFSEDNSLGISWVLGDDFNQFSPNGQYAFRTYTPRNVKNLKLADLFKALLAFHNYNISPQQPIDFKNCGWVFYKQSPLFFPKGSKALDPEKTVVQNSITFQKLSKAQRAKSESSGVFLSKDFRFAIIYIYRTHPQGAESKQLPI